MSPGPPDMPPRPRGNAESPALHAGLASHIGRGLEATAGAVGAVGGAVGAAITSPLRLTLRPRQVRRPTAHRQVGAPPGVTPDQLRRLSLDAEPAHVSVFDYSPDRVEVQEVLDPLEFFTLPRPDWTAVRWVNICGLEDLRLISAIQQGYALHPLAVEDVLHLPQRPKAERYESTGEFAHQLFIVVRMIRLVGNALADEQVSIFLGTHTVLTIQERVGDVFDPVRARIRTAGSMLRSGGADFLVYALLDTTVDHVFPILDRIGTRLDELDLHLYEDARHAAGVDVGEADFLREVHALKGQLMLLRRDLTPLQAVIAHLLRPEEDPLSDQTRTYLRDVADHVAHARDLADTYLDLSNSLLQAHMAAVSNRMNEVMKVLTMIAAVFIPISFLAGVFGMNFDNIPGLHSRNAFAFFCLSCLTLAGGMAWWFRRRGWW